MQFSGRRNAAATCSGKDGIWIEAQTSRISCSRDHSATTPNVSIGTVALRPQRTGKESWCGLSAKSSFTGPQVNFF